MGKLLLYDESQQSFDQAEIERLLRRMAAVRSIRKHPDVIAAVEADWVHEASTVIVRLISTCRMIALEGDFHGATSAAWEISQHLDCHLHVIDQGYTFDVAISDSSTIDELRAAVLASSR